MKICHVLEMSLGKCWREGSWTRDIIPYTVFVYKVGKCWETLRWCKWKTGNVYWNHISFQIPWTFKTFSSPMDLSHRVCIRWAVLNSKNASANMNWRYGMQMSYLLWWNISRVVVSHCCYAVEATSLKRLYVLTETFGGILQSLQESDIVFTVACFFISFTQNMYVKLLPRFMNYHGWVFTIPSLCVAKSISKLQMDIELKQTRVLIW
jgi:hypothetical protein